MRGVADTGPKCKAEWDNWGSRGKNVAVVEWESLSDKATAVS